MVRSDHAGSDGGRDAVVKSGGENLLVRTCS